MSAEDFQEITDAVSRVIEGAGVAVIVVGLLWALGWFAQALVRREADSYRRLRRRVGMAILLGLEFLVAADIVRTVAVAPTFSDLGVLALLIVVRTFLSFTLELEVEGRWPWQSRPERATTTS